jgi:putative transposase
LAFTTKYRRGALTDPILTRCQQITADVCQDFGTELHEVQRRTGTRTYSCTTGPPSKLVNSLSGVSARYLRQKHQAHLRRDLWGAALCGPRSYFAGSCSGAPLAMVKQYIENRKHPGG